MKGIIKTGITVGNGAAINIQLGWIPTHVQLFNASDGDLITTAFLRWVLPFTSGGVNALVRGSTIKGLTSGAKATVADLLLYSGSFEAGDAAGFATLEEESLVGTFAAENIVITNLASGVAGGVDDATVTANVTHNIAIAAGTAAATGTSALSRYEGAPAMYSKGFTIGQALAEEGKVLRYLALRDDG